MLQRIASLLRMQPPTIENRGLLWASGSTVPVDGTDGYQTGCLFQHTDGGADTSIYVNEGTVTSCDFNPSLVSSLNDLADVGAALAYTAGNILSADGSVYQETDDIALPLAGSFALGAFAGSGAAGSGVVLTSTKLAAASVFAETVADWTSAYLVRAIRGRLLCGSSSLTFNQETYGIQGQLVIRGTTLNHLHAGVLGTLEAITALTTSGAYTYGAAAVMARVGGATGIITATKPVSGFLAFWSAGALASGKSVAFAACVSSTTPWDTGLCLPRGSVVQGIRVGDWVGSGAAGSAILFSTAQNIYSDGQLDIVSAYGESTSDLTSAYSAKCGRFRHLIVGSSVQVNHETYGLVGQLVSKSASLLHMHAGLMGTLEANTTAVVTNGAYAYSVAAVIARIGGTNLITATKPVCGFSAVHNGAALAGGTSAAFAACAVSTGNWTHLLAADNCDNFFYAETGTDYENGVKITGITSLGAGASGVLRVKVASTLYYIPLYAAGELSGE